MRKIIFSLFTILLVLLIPAALKFSDSLIINYSAKAAKLMKTNEYLPGLKIQSLNFTTAGLSSLDTIIWQDITSQIRIENKLFSGQPFVVHIKSIELILLDLFQKKFRLSVNGLTASQAVQGTPSDETKQQNGLEKGHLRMDFEFDFLRPQTSRAQISALITEIATLAHTGKTIIPIDFSAIASFTISNELVKALITSQRDDQGYSSLIVNKEFFKTIIWLMADNLTEAEAGLLSINPFKVPRLLEIMNIAKRESEQFKGKKEIPEDAYRHVLWSYLLTKEYGPEFSKLITDAHEFGDDTNTEAEHRMDYNNNDVGRQYAQKLYKRDEILTYLLGDPNVIRAPL